MPSFREGLSFDDVLLVPKQTSILPSEVDTSTTFLPGIVLKSPIVSAPMDTVTDARVAIAMAREGGVGVLHRNMGIDLQAEQVDRVKRSEHGVITNPIKLGPEKTIQDALDLMERFHISGVPIVSEDGTLVGILTNRDIRFENDYTKLIKERMTSKDLITARVGTNLEEAEQVLADHRIEKLPIVDENNRLTGLITIKDILKVKRHPNATKDSKGRLVVGAAIGALREPYERAKALYDAGADFIVIDAAHGHSVGVMECVKMLKKKLPNLMVIAGNVATKEGVKALHDLGADGLRLGRGAGSICTTRVVAGVGSIGAMKQGSSDRYFAVKDSGAIVPEGVEGRVPFKGALHETMHQLMGGLKSGMGYCGASSLTELRNRAEFLRITGAGLRESHPHDVWITKEPPNYSSPYGGGEKD